MKLAVFPEVAPPYAGGLDIVPDDPLQHRQVLDKLDALGLRTCLAPPRPGRPFALSIEAAHALVDDGDTLNLCRDLGLDTVVRLHDLEREIVLAMLAAPRPLHFASAAEFLAAVAIRRNIVEAARATQLTFGTAEADRPASHWTYDEDRGFTVLPGRSLVEALTLATQPEAGDGRTYAFSCYRATEYVMLLGIARELERVNPALLAAIQRQWETRAIQSGAFHDVFLVEYGAADAPLPPRWYVPGDRVWFRNPDAHSSDASGYEGSWVIYLGNGLFSNFWQRDRPYSLVAKCLEIYHWRDGTYIDAAGDVRMDEAIVAAKVAETAANPAALATVVARMSRLRDGRGVYADGGCIDFSREFARNVCPGTADIVLPG
ncbi:hypothetical protein HAV22_15890 [Massilia sp. TW-1]|uniref:Lipoprotein n=1 Tax=Telluria antibiotica TaxID=2717319 RepID=A0ABX0PF50_9BURK|nr:hypothetical protein [Telluria antibiotica]